MEMKKTINIELTKGEILQAIFQYLGHMIGENFSDSDTTLVMNEFTVSNVSIEKNVKETVGACFVVKQ